MKEGLDSIYDVMFNPSFLIRYGYYDVMTKNKEVDIIENYKNYGRTESVYFKIFNMECLANYMIKSDLSIYFELDKIKRNNMSTEPINFSIPKGVNSRRQYKMPNLYSYLLLSYFICENQEEFKKMFKENNYSVSKYFNQNKFKFNTTKKIKDRLLYGGNKRLHLDLANFYHTLYTHSIPWMIMGKNKAKKDRRNGFANHLDKLITECQYGETHGIPTGNMLSRIVAELYMCYFDMHMKDKGYKYARYVDDFIYPYSLEEEKVAFLKDFNLMCRSYNLIINENKTIIDEYPFKKMLDKREIFTFLTNLTNKQKESTWINKINELLDLCISEEANGNKGSIKSFFSVIIYAIKNKRLSTKMVNNLFSHQDYLSEFNLFEKILDVSLKDSTLSNRFLEFFEQITILGFCTNKASNIVKKYFKINESMYKSKILNYEINYFNQELYQILLYIVQFDVRSFFDKEDLLKLINERLDDYSLILVTMIYLKRKNRKQDDLIKAIDQLLSKTHKQYPDNSKRMSEKFWLFRYFFYYIQKQNIIEKRIVNRYCNNKGYNVTNKGYESELNWNFIRNNPHPNKIDDFFNELLKNDVWLVYCGENNDFSYLT